MKLSEKFVHWNLAKRRVYVFRMVAVEYEERKMFKPTKFRVCILSHNSILGLLIGNDSLGRSLPKAAWPNFESRFCYQWTNNDGFYLMQTTKIALNNSN